MKRKTYSLADLKRTKTAPIVQYLESPEIVQWIAETLPDTIGVERIKRLALTCLRMDSKLASCEPASLLSSVLEAASLGLEISSPMGHCWLVPFGNQATLMIGWKGYVELAARRGVKMYARLVYSEDEFTLSYEPAEDANARWCHEPMTGDRGEVIGAYAVAVLEDGYKMFHFCHMDDLEKRRKNSRASNDGPWVDWRDEMYLKTAMRMLAAQLPLGPQIARAHAADSAADQGMAAGEAVVLDVESGGEVSELRERVDGAKQLTDKLSKEEMAEVEAEEAADA